MKEQLYLCNGQLAPDFTFSTSEGKTYSLGKIIKENKLTLLHFWSNSSVDRKRIHKELVSVYKKYSNQGLQIVSVSLDANPEKWKKTVNEDQIPGLQTCDLKEEDGVAAKLYKSSPKSTINILIDQSGKMIAWDVDGPSLFGYLYKILGK